MSLVALDADVVLVDLVLEELLEQAATVMAAAHPIAPIENLRPALMSGRYAPRGSL